MTTEGYCTLDDHVSRAHEFCDAVDSDALVNAVVGRFDTVKGENGFSTVAATDCCFRGGDLNSLINKSINHGRTLIQYTSGFGTPSAEHNNRTL